MLFSTLINLIFTPGLYVVLQRNTPRSSRVGQLPGRDDTTAEREPTP